MRGGPFICSHPRIHYSDCIHSIAAIAMIAMLLIVFLSLVVSKDSDSSSTRNRKARFW